MNGTTVLATISGSGSVTPMTTAAFMSPADTSRITVQITNNGGQQTQVVPVYVDVFWVRTIYAGQWTFACEDTPNGGDCDFNDAVVTLSWTTRAH